MANKSNWKGAEREVAKAFGTTRAPVSNNVTRSDTFSNACYIEVKKRKHFWVWELFKDTEIKAKKENKIPVVCLKQKYKKGFLIVAKPEDIQQVAEQLNLK